jgi:hypothetical protein
VERINAWGEDRIIVCDKDGNCRTVLTSWTDYLPEGRVLETSADAADFKYEDLQLLAKLVDDILKSVT